MTPEGVGISIVSVAELYLGVFYSTDPASSEEILLEFIQGYEVVQLDDDICWLIAQERGRLKEAGTSIGDLDLLIGSTTLRHGVTLLTNNRRYSERLSGLNILSAKNCGHTSRRPSGACVALHSSFCFSLRNYCT